MVNSRELKEDEMGGEKKDARGNRVEKGKRRTGKDPREVLTMKKMQALPEYLSVVPATPPVG